MNVMPEGIIVNSCQYTPVYLIQDPGASQGRSYFITQSNVDEPKPVSDNLKAFYESSGNIENSVINVQRPRIVRKPENCVVGNNLKLASFLLPKNENVNKQQQYVLNNVVLKSISNSNCTTSTVNTVPRLNIDSKIVKLNNTELKSKYQRVERSTPKTKPKEIIQNVVAPAPTKHTSVQLLKLGETYHSLNQLSDDQMKMVSQALKIFSNPEKIAPEPTYDPVTNTKFIYKVVSPKDLTVVGKNKVQANKIYEAKIDNIINNNTHILAKDMVKKDLFQKEIKTDIKKDNSIKTDVRKDNIGKTEKKDVLHKSDCKKDIKHDLKKDNLIKNDCKKDNLMKDYVKKETARRMKTKKQEDEEEKAKQKLMKELKQDEDDYYRSIAETKVTRSGRKVKFPKLNLPEDSPHKPKKKHTSVTCFQCAAEFSSLYRLQKHYESHPTHIPAKIHSNLFHCLLAIVKSGTEEDRTNIFIQQLEQLIVKLRSLLPCLVRKKTEGKVCTINDDVSRLLGVEPGKYNFDIDSLTCVKNKDGFCHHYPPPPPLQLEASPQPWITVDEEANLPTAVAEGDDCARINSVEKWPTVNKRVWKQKQQKEKAKRMRLASENCDTLIELGDDDMVILNDSSDDCSAILSMQGAEDKADSQLLDNKECDDFSEPEVICLSQPEQLCLPESDPMCLPEPNAEPYEEVLPQSQPVSFLTTEPATLLNSEPVRLLNPDTACLVSSNTDIKLPSIKYKNGNHMQFHSAHFDIRSSPIKPSSTVFRKFQINTELLAKYEQTMRSIETVDNKDLEPENEITETSVEDTQDTVTLNHEDTLQEIFRDEDLSAVKESFTLDKELKDWILNRSNDDKSEDGFSKTNTLIEPALLHIKDNENKTSMNNEIDQKDVLSSGDNHDESSVLNFLDTLANDLSYPGTEIRTNNGDFQLDLFSFTSS